MASDKTAVYFYHTNGDNYLNHGLTHAENSQDFLGSEWKANAIYTPFFSTMEFIKLGSLDLGSIGLGVGLSLEVRSWSEPGLEGTSFGLGNVDMCYLNYGSRYTQPLAN